MSSGIRATVTFSSLSACPLAVASTVSESAIEQVSTSAALPGENGSVTEFLADGDSEAICEACAEAGVPVEPVFEYGTATLFRLKHEEEERCPCECLGRHGCPVHRYVAADGELTLVFHASSFELLQEVMGEFRESYAPVDVQRLLQPPLDGTPEERVFVNRGTLTDRQYEVLSVAFERGYFDRPKQANATELADELGITQSTFTEHLMAAHRKLLADILD